MWFLYLLFSIAASFGISMVLVKKQDEWPISIISKILKTILGILHKKLPNMLDCTVCTSFWVTLFTDLIVKFFFASNYFAWPMSGFIALGVMWVISDMLDSLYALGSRNEK